MLKPQSQFIHPVQRHLRAQPGSQPFHVCLANLFTSVWRRSGGRNVACDEHGFTHRWQTDEQMRRLRRLLWLPAAIALFWRARRRRERRGESSGEAASISRLACAPRSCCGEHLASLTLLPLAFLRNSIKAGSISWPSNKSLEASSLVLPANCSRNH